MNIHGPKKLVVNTNKIFIFDRNLKTVGFFGLASLQRRGDCSLQKHAVCQCFLSWPASIYQTNAFH